MANGELVEGRHRCGGRRWWLSMHAIISRFFHVAKEVNIHG